MINQKDSKQVKMGSWFLKLLSRDMKTKTKYKTNKKSLKKQEIKAMQNITTIMDYCPINGQMVDADP